MAMILVLSTGITISPEVACCEEIQSEQPLNAASWISRHITLIEFAGSPCLRFCGRFAPVAAGTYWRRPVCIMNNFKSYASRKLNSQGLDGPDRKRWARHGSRLWKDEDVFDAIRYVVEEQGEPMAVFVAEGI
jgi:hypothetical protein